MLANMLIVVILFCRPKSDQCEMIGSMPTRRYIRTERIRLFSSRRRCRECDEIKTSFFRESNLSDIANRYDMYMNITKI